MEKGQRSEKTLNVGKTKQREKYYEESENLHYFFPTSDLYTEM